MKTQTKTIGKDLTVFAYSTKQRGYGRQALYFEFIEIDGLFYIQDVFPNVVEHFDILLRRDAFPHEEKGFFTNGNGDGKYAESELQDSVIEALASIFNGDEIKVEEEEEINLY
jgi:hypothetical protein